MLKSKGEAFWKECFELIVTTLITAVLISYKKLLTRFFFNVLVAILGQEKWMKIPSILLVEKQINLYIGMQ